MKTRQAGVFRSRVEHNVDHHALDAITPTDKQILSTL